MKAVGRKTFITALTLTGMITPCSFLTSCSNSNAIQLANFESYMSNSLIQDLHAHYDIQFPHYTVTENIETKFQRYYDLAIPSCYEMFVLLKRGWLEPIDWAKFEIGVADAEEAKNLFNSNIINNLNAQFKYFCEHDETFDWGQYFETTAEGLNVNVLKYGIPYFAQSFMFAYKAQEELKWYEYEGTHKETTTPTWPDVFYTVSKNNQFIGQKGKRLGMLDDSKSIYDVARICQTILAGAEPTNEMDPDAKEEQDRETLNTIADLFAPQPSKFILNSDSGTVSRLFADPNGCAGAFAWTGDLIYSAMGAEEFEPDYEHFFIPNTSVASLDEVDLFVINKKNSNLTEKRDNIYKIVKQICLEGCKADDIVAYDEEKGRYKYWTVENFDNLDYTPVLSQVYNAVCDDQDRSKYWENKGVSESALKIFLQLLTNINRNDVKHLFGRVLTPEQNSDVHWAWTKTKDKF